MSIVLRQAGLLAVKDLQIFFRDRIAAFFAFIFPFMFVIGFTLALSGQGPSDDQLRLTIANQDDGAISRNIIRGLAESGLGLAESGAAEGGIVLRDYAEARAAVEAGELDGFITFPAGFSDRLQRGQPAPLQLTLAADAGPGPEVALRGLASNLAGQVSETLLAGAAVRNLTGRPAAEQRVYALAAAGEGRMPSVQFETVQVGEVEPFNIANVTLPGYLTMFLFFAAAMQAESIARERRSHTLERLLSHGARRESVILGKFLGTAGIGLTQIALMWLVGLLAFGVELGESPAAVILLSLLMGLASAAFGVLLGSLVSNHRTASTAGVLISLVLAPLGGCWWPLFITPQWLQQLARLTPHGWANGGFNKLMVFNAGLGDVTAEMAALAAFGAAFLLLALWRFRMAAG